MLLDGSGSAYSRGKFYACADYGQSSITPTSLPTSNSLNHVSPCSIICRVHSRPFTFSKTASTPFLHPSSSSTLTEESAAATSRLFCFCFYTAAIWPVFSSGHALVAQ